MKSHETTEAVSSPGSGKACEKAQLALERRGSEEKWMRKAGTGCEEPCKILGQEENHKKQPAPVVGKNRYGKSQVMRRLVSIMALLLVLGPGPAFAARFWDLGPGISTGMTSDGKVVSFSSGASANSAAIWSVQYGTRNIGSYSTSGMAWKGSTLIVAGNLNGQAQRWDGNIQGVGSWSALPRADNGVYPWTANRVSAMASDGVNVMIAGSSVYTSDYAHACRYKDNGATAGCTNLGLPTPNGHDVSYLRGVSEGDVCIGAAQFMGTPPSGGARQTIAGTPLCFLGNLMGNPINTNEAIGLAISGNGSRAVGWSYISTDPIILQGCYWDAPLTANRVAHAIPYVSGYYWSSATAISRTGTYIGGAMWQNGDVSQTAFLWDAAHGTRLIKDILAAAGIDLTGWQLSDDCDVEVDFDGMFDIAGISEDGKWITGTGRYGGTGPYNGERRAWVACLNDAPAVSGILPSTAPNTGPVQVTISGTGFLSGATVKLTRAGQSDLTGTGVSVPSSSTLTCSFNLTGEAPGQWDVVATNTDGQSGTLAKGFAVVQPGGGYLLAPVYQVTNVVLTLTNTRADEVYDLFTVSNLNLTNWTFLMRGTNGQTEFGVTNPPAFENYYRAACTNR